MNQWKEILEYCLNKNLAKIILSNPRQKDGIRKVEIRPVLLKGNLLFQASAYTQKQVQHYNLTEKEVYEKTAGWMENMKQLISKKVYLVIVLLIKVMLKLEHLSNGNQVKNFLQIQQ